jgi:L-fuculose-phosphate aldolase
VEEVLAELARAGRDAVERGLIWGRAGNLSTLVSADEFVISASGARLDDLEPPRLVRCRLDGEGFAGAVRPSVEVEMHRRIYKAVPEARAVLHTSAPYTTLLACSRLRVPTRMSTDALYYVGRVARVPYAHPGSVDLARAAAARARRSPVLLLNNHGSLVWAGSADEALIRTEALEFLARLLVTARAARVPLAFLTDEQVAKFT